MTLRVVYRSYGGDNHKDRPRGYSKLLCLQSFVRALEGVDVDVVFLNDGPVPVELLELMRGAGRVEQLVGSGMRASYWGALQLATRRPGWHDDDVVWFSEDDYLYRPDALRALARAAQDPATASADYFALYGSTPGRSVLRPEESELPDPRGWQAGEPRVVGEQEWRRLRSTASTFGGRVRALRQDLGIFRLCMWPHKTMLRDHDTCLVLQGSSPYTASDLLRPVVQPVLGGGRGLSGAVRHAVLLPFLAATALRSLRRPSRRRTFLAAAPNLATHMEDGRLAPGTDWARVAEEVRSWAAQPPVLDLDDERERSSSTATGMSETTTTTAMIGSR
ncbi:hypothetical protein [Quadrisphaera setariae]|uniref:Glycosyl transferase family 2 n=1 Tax=Quadrisphaera setariae TaxID=2593304 RepID=A0A5C8ZGN9_9ACTN|nr:hypothetical protein [Quadrisphaera setariae]TXR56977.1 hypothetical protein FMM08_05625 [Quadrisphaera setariae]